ncbi:hypothetical protein L1987_02059 [Smallanthus sonchifolius]|uniref:Uncharacterized protein n=1 Tax=Smallanthus sonchifolius TaxID=185202 RepID=A0ACB9K6P4_9ASTR|nr:hypothetical protein L1987_02059 [Smallanthus sonchifolius]
MLTAHLGFSFILQVHSVLVFLQLYKEDSKANVIVDVGSVQVTKYESGKFFCHEMNISCIEKNFGLSVMSDQKEPDKYKICNLGAHHPLEESCSLAWKLATQQDEHTRLAVKNIDDFLSGLGGFVACNSLSQRNDDPTKASRSWDVNRDGFVMGVILVEQNRDGFVMGEGAGVAKARDSKIYAEFMGGSFTCDSYHMTEPHPDCALGLTLREMYQEMSTKDKILLQSKVNSTKVNRSKESIVGKVNYSQRLE